MKTPTTPIASPATTALWMAARMVALLATVVFIVGFFVRPELFVKLLWGLVIPLVPASLLLSPRIWRNLCPLATLEMPRRDWTGQHIPKAATVIRWSVLGMVLLGVLVPLRHVLFNGHNPSDGTYLGVAVVAVALLAFGLGRAFHAKVGFCNSICPVLPVERLYGQQPLVEVPNPRCVPCTHCTAAGCIDHSPEKSIPRILARARRGRPWYLTPFGVFACAFPGFVLGYYLAPDGTPETAGTVFLRVAEWAAASWTLFTSVAALTGVEARRAFPVLGAAAVGIYYWFGGPTIARTLSLEASYGDFGAASWALRAAAFLLIAVWFARAWRAAPT